METKLPAGRPTESIYDDGEEIIAMADVQHIDRLHTPNNEGAIWVITKHTTWNVEMDSWNNPIYIPADRAPRFIRAWCVFRGEVDQVVSGASSADEADRNPASVMKDMWVAANLLRDKGYDREYLVEVIDASVGKYPPPLPPKLS